MRRLVIGVAVTIAALSVAFVGTLAFGVALPTSGEVADASHVAPGEPGGAGAEAPVSASTASASSAHPAGTPRISLVVPRRAEPESTVSASGKVLDDAGSGWVRVERRGSRGWKAVGRSQVRGRRFALTFDLPAAGSLATRAVLFHGRRAVAVSPTKKIAIASAARVPGPAPPGPAQAVTSAPATHDNKPAHEPEGAGAPATTNSYWGAWIGDQFTGEEAPWDTEAMDDFEAEVGKAPSLIEFSSPFADCASTPCTNYSFPTTPFEHIRARGAIPLLSWSSQSLPSSVNEPDYELSDIADGSHDAYIREFARAAAAWGHPFFLRFDWEMNGGWFPWGAGVNGNTAADYIAAWRHVHGIFEEVGATDASWVWCPYVDPNAGSGSKLADMATLYPGDDYVDWTSLDGYNWGPSAEPPRAWRSFSYLFGPSYRQVTEEVAPRKPMLVGETASAEEGGSKSGWIEAAFAALPTEFPRIQGLTWFDKEDNGMDWPLESSASATSAFAEGIAAARYLGGSFGALDTSPIPAP